MIPVQLHW